MDRESDWIKEKLFKLIRGEQEEKPLLSSVDGYGDFEGTEATGQAGLFGCCDTS